MFRPGFATLLALLLTACTLPHEPTLEVVPDVPPATMADIEVLTQEVAGLRAQVENIDLRTQGFEGWLARLSRMETLLLTVTVRKAKGKPDREPNTVQLVKTAEKEASVYPSERGYWGKSAEQTFTWAPGGLYVIYLTWNHPTAISLPPGELVAIGLKLDPDLYDVEHQTVGRELTAYSAITIRPKFEKGDANVALWTKSGKRYLFHLIVGSWGLTAVTFESSMGAPAPTTQPQKLILPNPNH